VARILVGGGQTGPSARRSRTTPEATDTRPRRGGPWDEGAGHDPHPRAPAGRHAEVHAVEDFRAITEAIRPRSATSIINYSTGAIGVPSRSGSPTCASCARTSPR
jgi:hypothetical protein